MLIIALTGGIGSGKSTVENMFQSYGIPIIDTDVIARELLTNNAAVKQETIDYFGEEIAQANGEIDRTKLRTLIFEDEEARNALQLILHPIINQQTKQQLKQLESSAAPYCIIIIPLLAESQYAYPQDRVLLIDSPETLQIKRASSRDQSTPDLIAKIIASQASREQRQAIADDIIMNDKDLSSLQKQVDILHKRYCSMASSEQNTHP